MNLVGNAIKFTETGEVVVSSELESDGEDELVIRFSVSDTGIGIPQAKLQSIFAPFEQADSSTTRRFGGTGLGLTISTQLVRMMGGRIWLESEVGSGSTFYFTLRLGRQQEAVREPPRAERRYIQTMTPPQRTTVQIARQSKSPHRRERLRRREFLSS